MIAWSVWIVAVLVVLSAGDSEQMICRDNLTYCELSEMVEVTFTTASELSDRISYLRENTKHHRSSIKDQWKIYWKITDTEARFEAVKQAVIQPVQGKIDTIENDLKDLQECLDAPQRKTRSVRTHDDTLNAFETQLKHVMETSIAQNHKLSEIMFSFTNIESLHERVQTKWELVLEETKNTHSLFYNLSLMGTDDWSQLVNTVQAALNSTATTEQTLFQFYRHLEEKDIQMHEELDNIERNLKRIWEGVKIVGDVLDDLERGYDKVYGCCLNVNGDLTKKGISSYNISSS